MYGEWTEQDEYEHQNRRVGSAGAINRSSLTKAEATIASLRAELEVSQAQSADLDEALSAVREVMSRQHRLSRDEMVTALAAVLTSTPTLAALKTAQTTALPGWNGEGES